MGPVMKQVTAPQTTVTVSKKFSDRLANAGNAILTEYYFVLDRQKTVGVKSSQIILGAMGCLLTGALFGLQHGKSLGFLATLLSGIAIGAILTFLVVCYQVSNRNPQPPAKRG